MRQVKSGMVVVWEAEHKDGLGNLITRQVSIEPPLPPTCIRLACLARYLKDALVFALICSYHQRRVAYAEANRNKKILERYRTGEPSPRNLIGALIANIKLTCPIRRKYEIGRN